MSHSSHVLSAETIVCVLSSVPYRALTGTFDLIQNTTKRLEIARYLTRFLGDVIKLTPGDLLKTVYLCINRAS